jgi:cytochrome c biogenesis protein CcmG/thiol:disulfide interchange protein DsbE
MRRKPFVTFVAAMAVTLMVLFSIERTGRSAGHLGTTSADVEDKVARDFTLQSIDGKTVRLSDFRGKAVLLNFWATYCAPCRIEMPWFVELQNRYGAEGLQVVGVAMDDASPNDIEKFANDLGVNYPILVGEETVGNAFGGVQFLPSTFYIGRDGKVVDKVFDLKKRNEIEEDIKRALAQSQVTQAWN